MPEQAEERPEALPVGLEPPKEFLFDFAQVEQAKQDNQRLVDHYEERLDKLIKTFTINDMPIIQPILGLTHDKEELKRLAKGLDRVADVVAALDELNTRQSILEYAEKDPIWFKASFANLEEEIERALTNTPKPELNDEDKDLLG